MLKKKEINEPQKNYLNQKKNQKKNVAKNR